MKILIIEDAEPKAKEVEGLLQEIPNVTLDIDVAPTGIAARECLARTKYDLLVLDIHIPLREGDEADRRGGINLLSEITLSTRLLRPTHVVALTGFDDLKAEFESRFNNGQWAIEKYDPQDIGWRERLKAKASYIAREHEQGGSAYDLDLCVVTALNSPELDAVRSLSWDWRAPEALDQNMLLYKGSFTSEGKEFKAAAVAAPRMGMVSAATITTKAIAALRPRLIAMVGICAGVKDTVDLGDVLVADPSWDWQMGKYVKEALHGAPDQIGLSVGISELIKLLAGDRAFFIDLSEMYQGVKPNRIPTLHPGPVASGSAVIADDATVEIIKAQHRKILGVDMELYGVYSAVRDSASPKPMVIGIKSVCDLADHLKNNTYQAYASYLSAQVLRAFVERYGAQLLK